MNYGKVFTRAKNLDDLKRATRERLNKERPHFLGIAWIRHTTISYRAYLIEINVGGYMDAVANDGTGKERGRDYGLLNLL